MGELARNDKVIDIHAPVLYYKRIPLPPTHFDVDVIICQDYNMAKAKAVKLYGKANGEGVYDSMEVPGCTGFTHIARDRQNCRHIVLAASDIYDLPLIVHEAIHVTWRLHKLCGFRFRYGNQEIQAYWMEYIISHIMGMVPTDNK